MQTASLWISVILISHNYITASISIHRTNVCSCFNTVFLNAVTWPEHPKSFWQFQMQFVSHSLSSSETVEREKSYKTALGSAEKDHCHLESKLPALLDQLLPISAATITMKGKGDKESHHTRPEDPNWKEGTVEGFLLDTHATQRCHSPHRRCHISWAERDLSTIRSSAVNHSIERRQCLLREVRGWARKTIMLGQRKGNAKVLELLEPTASIWILRWLWQSVIFQVCSSVITRSFISI